MIDLTLTQEQFNLIKICTKWCDDEQLTDHLETQGVNTEQLEQLNDLLHRIQPVFELLKDYGDITLDCGSGYFVSSLNRMVPNINLNDELSNGIADYFVTSCRNLHYDYNTIKHLLKTEQILVYPQKNL